jgi:hypothetical protein
VLQVVLSLNPGGTERLVVELASRLHREMPMMVCCLDTAGTWACDLEEQGIAVRALGRAPGFRPALGRAIARLSAAHRADVIHAHHYSPFVYSCLSRFWRAGPRVVFTEHGRLSDSGPSPKRRLANRALADQTHLELGRVNVYVHVFGLTDGEGHHSRKRVGRYSELRDPFTYVFGDISLTDVVQQLCGHRTR